ncbi:MAG: carboxylating nicotinate-nucleotide diphosphorylase [Deltaproteobacteria bacterium]|nr:carboxylating nicotinate-nucleotide diphosphorylase [Deltaproteobacteria bacterium]
MYGEMLDPITRQLIDLALAEDLGAGDVTTAATVDPAAHGVGEIIAKEPCVLSGLAVAGAVFCRLDPQLSFQALRPEGDRLSPGTVVARISGRLAALLAGERVALNFLRRLSGVATLTARYVAAARAGSARVRVVDTRKTTPGMRSLEKAAVRAGGGCNHRFHLGDGVLIKDNHIVAAGGIGPALARARATAHHLLKVEVEVQDLAGLAEALQAGAEVVLLDNMSPEQVAAAVALNQGRALLEVSGGVTLATIAAYARTGVQLVSVGALTHAATDVDLSLELLPPAADDAAAPAAPLLHRQSTPADWGAD